METLFLACFAFGAIFTIVSVVSGFGHSSGGDAGFDGPSFHGHDVPHAGHGGDLGHDTTVGVKLPKAGHGLPLLNVSSLLAFLTWFGAAGFLLLHFAAWPLPAALAGAIVAGLAGWLLIALFLRQVLAGESEMDPRDYQLQGTVGRVTVGIPAEGVGEIVFSKGNVRRSEAARGVGGRAISRETEVVILDYARGIAQVQPWDEFIASSDSRAIEQDAPRTGAEA